MSEAEFKAYMADRTDVTIIQELSHQMNLPALPAHKANKWGNKPTDVDGYHFQSKLEANRYGVLKAWEKLGLISSLSVQFDDKAKHTWVLQDGFRLPTGKKQRAILYIDDFQYIQNDCGLLIVEDTKGKETTDFKQKAKMFFKRYPTVNFFINHAVRGWYKP